MEIKFFTLCKPCQQTITPIEAYKTGRQHEGDSQDGDHKFTRA